MNSTKAFSCIGVVPSNDTTKLLVQQAIVHLQATSSALASLKLEMQSLALLCPNIPWSWECLVSATAYD